MTYQSVNTSRTQPSVPFLTVLVNFARLTAAVLRRAPDFLKDLQMLGSIHQSRKSILFTPRFHMRSHWVDIAFIVL